MYVICSFFGFHDASENKWVSHPDNATKYLNPSKAFVAALLYGGYVIHV